jgi:hypothetical protein
MATAAVTTEHCNLSLQELRESPTNPRQRFDETALNELADLCVWAHKRRFVSLIILWPRRRNGACEEVVRSVEGT